MTVKSLSTFGVASALLAATAMFAAPAEAQWRQSPRQSPQRAEQDRLLYTWTGRVDKEMQISMRGSRPTVEQIGNNEKGTGRVSRANALPERPGRVVAERVEGRGAVDVIQQPSARNGYVAVVRLRDPSSGAANYGVRVYWEPTGNYSDNGRYGNGGYDSRRDDDRDNRSQTGRRAYPRN